MRILLLHNIINPHMTPVFENLAGLPGIELNVAYFAETEGDRHWQADAGSSFPSHVLPGKHLNLFRAWDTVSFHFNPGLRRFLRQTPWDVLINAGWSSWSNWQAFFECRRQGKPHVLWAGSTEHEKTWLRTLALPAVRYFVKHSEAWVSYGTASARYLQQLGARAERIVPAYHCVDSDRFLARSAELTSSIPALRHRLGLDGMRVVLFVGRLVERKGGQDLIRAYLGLSRTLPHVALVLVGDGPARSNWEALARNQGTGKIVFAGNVGLDALPAYYHLADLFVLPSHQEVWGLVVNEAALSGLPLVVTNVCGAAADLVEESVNGYAVPPMDVEALGETIGRVLRDQELAIQMGRESRRIVAACNPASAAAALARAAHLAWQARSL